MLDLRKVILPDTLLNEIGMLVHLRCLIIQTKVEAEALPPSFSNLCNLETLKVINWVSNMVLSPTIWNLAKLRHVDTRCCSVFNSDIGKPTKLENLTSLKFLYLSCSVDSADIFKRFRNLRTLEFIMEFSEAEQIYFPRLDLLNKLEIVHAYFESSEGTHVIADESFPVLEELYIKCDKLIEIPESFGDIASLKLIKVYGSPQLKESALNIKEYVEEITGEDKLEAVGFVEAFIFGKSVHLRGMVKWKPIVRVRTHFPQSRSGSMMRQDRASVSDLEQRLKERVLGQIPEKPRAASHH
ncbi:putative cycloartenol synthase-like [Capsicum annuum]|uniref:Disease resistance R13L4/SHOC-2-like LRR domain-containing protein n=1 Tax=Capsicum annuum TaxID=4072 RepID=A0A2G2ZGD7_CAPAN|nr:putative cycloartenol synthase-like [Capsicum annuum]PHT80975.1 hypothetical protein T459_13990 [Capsicum annuum]